MTQVPHQRPVGIPVVPEAAPDTVEQPPGALGSEAGAAVATEARRFVLDIAIVREMSFAELVLRHARALSALRTVWASRRHWQSSAEQEPLGYVVLDGRSATPQLRSIGMARTRGEAEALIDKRAAMARYWRPGIRDVLCEIHPVRNPKGEQ